MLYPLPAPVHRLRATLLKKRRCFFGKEGESLAFPLLAKKERSHSCLLDSLFLHPDRGREAIECKKVS
ncbi:Putative hypothetical protein [Helicobacter mustelae 12198]|uniref:Uncharacterized protein n=1 Tax=Helicobacter mustelae (strain ATCC 43772 / CCUG 25715 / CIP 103759 / LMG 18044 / NCTC 12198 / R85-136P) TaxID=679897 RepID=D3UGP9_HELM1|nr:Putative hypothetical protein [Helicobacter mustelae 12198]